MAETWIQNLITVEYETVLRLWTGEGDLEFGGQTWRGGGAALRVSEVETASGEPDRRVTLTLSGIPRDLRREFLQDEGPLPVTVGWIYSTDRGGTWTEIPISFRGRLSTPALSDGVLTVEIETQRGDVDRGRPLRWSHEDQQRRFPGDLGMEYMRKLAHDDGIETGWPP